MTAPSHDCNFTLQSPVVMTAPSHDCIITLQSQVVMTASSHDCIFILQSPVVMTAPSHDCIFTLQSPVVMTAPSHDYIYPSESSGNDCSISWLYISSTIFAAPNFFLISSPIMISLLEMPINLPRKLICATSVLFLSYCFRPSTHYIKLACFDNALCNLVWLLRAIFLFAEISSVPFFNPLNAELNPICHLLALLGVHHFLHISRVRVKSLTLRLLTSYIYIYIYGAPILDVSRSHTTTHHSR